MKTTLSNLCNQITEACNEFDWVSDKKDYLKLADYKKQKYDKALNLYRQSIIILAQVADKGLSQNHINELEKIKQDLAAI